MVLMWSKRVVRLDVNKPGAVVIRVAPGFFKMQIMNSNCSPMHTYILYWKDGRYDVARGTNAFDALKKAGYDVSDINKLDFCTRSRTKDFQWNKESSTWEWSSRKLIRQKQTEPTKQ
jgi:hypothetical protein